MKYNFDTVIDRTSNNSYKWDVAENELPMWVADMDFDTAPAIKEAIIKRAQQGALGYNTVPSEWAQSFISWWDRRHHFKMQEDWIVFSTGVVPSLSSIVRKLTTPAENVMMLTPVYNIFYNSILNNGRRVLECPLHYENGVYDIDFEMFEEAAANPQTTLLFFCNPQNPSGNIWDKETLAKVGEICAKHHVVVVSDEIHCDLLDPGYEYTPFGSVSETCLMNSVTLIAPTKAFNIAGLQTSAAVIANPVLRHKVNRGLNTDEVAEPNSFAIQASIAAFNESEDWLDELREYLYENKKRVAEFLDDELSMCQLVESHATYLLWVDCKKITDNTKQLCKFIRKKTGLFITAGRVYGGNGKRFIRINTACPRVLLEDGLKRLKLGIDLYLTQENS